MHRTLLLTALLFGFSSGATAEGPPEGVLRVATYNVSMYRGSEGELLKELESGQSEQARRVAEVLQRVRPDVVLLNEFDYRPDARHAEALLYRYLAVPQAGQPPIRYPSVVMRPVNTGVDSGFDLDRDGATGGPADAIGFGRYPGQYGMLLLSRFKADADHTHSFRELLWKDTPHALLPTDPATGEGYYTEEELKILRLPSKSFWDVALRVPHPGSGQRRLHLLCSHPTPPVFDGPEDRNGLRNYDEIGLIAKYLDSAKDHPGLFKDDYSREAVVYPLDEPFVILGDLNADPHDGGGRQGAIQQLLDHPAVDSAFVPTSKGGAAMSRANPELNQNQKGDPAHHTANFNRDGYPNLRVDYALPSQGLKVVGGGVFWPEAGEPGAEAIEASDHRLVWIDIRLKESSGAAEKQTPTSTTR